MILYNLLIFILNNSSFLIALNPPDNASQPTTVDRIWETFSDICILVTSSVLNIDRKKDKNEQQKAR